MDYNEITLIPDQANFHLQFKIFFSCKMANHMLTKLYLTLRLCPILTLQSKDKGVLRVNPELPLRWFDRREPKG
jgi:hypothetical protein